MALPLTCPDPTIDADRLSISFISRSLFWNFHPLIRFQNIYWILLLESKVELITLSQDQGVETMFTENVKNNSNISISSDCSGEFFLWMQLSWQRFIKSDSMPALKKW